MNGIGETQDEEKRLAAGQLLAEFIHIQELRSGDGFGLADTLDWNAVYESFEPAIHQEVTTSVASENVISCIARDGVIRQTLKRAAQRRAFNLYFRLLTLNICELGVELRYALLCAVRSLAGRRDKMFH